MGFRVYIGLGFRASRLQGSCRSLPGFFGCSGMGSSGHEM